MLDPNYRSSKDESKKRKNNVDHSIVTQKKAKRRRTADPTYCNTQALVDSSNEELPMALVDEEMINEDAPTMKKRRRIIDPTYRETVPSLDSLSEMEEVARPRKKGTPEARPTEISLATKEHAAPSVHSSHNIEVMGKMQDAEDVPEVEETQDTEQVRRVVEMQIVPESPTSDNEVDTAETKDFFWERDWCVIM
jgi:hypothetical protein